MKGKVCYNIYYKSRSDMMGQSSRNSDIQTLIKTIAARTGITDEQKALVQELYADDGRPIEEIEIEILALCESITQIGAKIPMKKVTIPEMYSLAVETPIKGIYLGETQIDLMTISETSNTNELLAFIKNCAQVNYSEEQLQALCKMKLDSAKRKVFDDYRRTLVGPADLKRDPSLNLKNKIIELGLDSDLADEVFKLYKAGEVTRATDYITSRLNIDLGTIVAQTFKRHNFDYDDVKCSSYEEMEALVREVSKFDSITITAGKYYRVMNNGVFNPYHIRRVLDFCKKHDVQARYHGLLTQGTIEHFNGKPKEAVMEELRKYVTASIDFINRYNEENKLSDGMPVIRTVDIFNELINLKKDKTALQGYYNVWEQLGLSPADIVDIFAPAIGNKPPGVDYVYNEAFVETEEKRQVQLSLARKLKALAPELIDTFGTQMHITTEFKADTIEKTFTDLQRFSEETGIQLAITEFDMYVPEKTIDRLEKQGKTSAQISEYANVAKLAQLESIALAARNTGIEFVEISYWSATDSMDHNKQRQGRPTLYGGLFGQNLQPKGVNEVVEYAPSLGRPDNSKDVPGYLAALNERLEAQPMIEPQCHASSSEKAFSQQPIKSTNEIASTDNDDSGFANFPQLLIMTLIIIAILYILLM